MFGKIRQWLGVSLVGVATIGGLTACSGEIGVDPSQPLAGTAPLAVSCSDFRAPAGNRLSARVYAMGDQIYRWDGMAWVFVAPSARLYSGPDAAEQIGTHYAGPTWESVDGSKVVGTVLKRCTPSTTAIQWLLLSTVSTGSSGVMDGTTYIKRVSTVGGVAPAQPGSVIGELANVPY